MFSLKVEKGEPCGAVFELPPGDSTIGRSRSANLRLGASDISGLHARVTVAKGMATLENLSQFGTRVDDAPATGRVVLNPGQRLSLGKSTVLLFLQTADAGEGLAQEAGVAAVSTRGTPETKAADTGKTRFDSELTGAGLRAPTPAAQPQAPGKMAEPGTRTGAGGGFATKSNNALPDSDLTVGLPPQEWTDGGGTADGMTRAMQTRAASPEEIEHLRLTEQKRQKKRVMRGLAVLIPLVVLAVVFRPRTPPPEPKISWAKDANDDYLDLFEPAPGGGLAENGYDLCYPGPERFKKTATSDGMVLEGWIGQERNVPMRLILQDEQNVRFASLSREAFVEDWMQQQTANGERCSFDKPSTTPGFIGLRNGLPYIRVTYYRDNNGSWFGVGCVIRHGYRRIVIRAEAPAAERVRVEDLLSSKFMRVSETMEYSFWEPSADIPSLPESTILKQAEADLNRMAPATWVELQKTLSGLLTKTVQAGNKEAEAEAMRLLVRLHERQALWFNSQQLAFDAAIMQNNLPKALEIARFTKAVFKDMEDQRYYTVRKWDTEL